MQIGRQGGAFHLSLSLRSFSNNSPFSRTSYHPALPNPYLCLRLNLPFIPDTIFHHTGFALFSSFVTRLYFLFVKAISCLMLRREVATACKLRICMYIRDAGVIQVQVMDFSCCLWVVLPLVDYVINGSVISRGVSKFEIYAFGCLHSNRNTSRNYGVLVLSCVDYTVTKQN